MSTLAGLMKQTGYYRVKVTPRQPQTKLLRQLADGTIKIALQAIPEQGRANAELLRFLSAELDLTPANIRITSGLTSPLKIVHIEVVV